MPIRQRGPVHQDHLDRCNLGLERHTSTPLLLCHYLNSPLPHSAMVKAVVKQVSGKGVVEASPACIEIPHRVPSYLMLIRIYAQGLRWGD